LGQIYSRLVHESLHIFLLTSSSCHQEHFGGSKECLNITEASGTVHGQYFFALLEKLQTRCMTNWIFCWQDPLQTGSS